MSKKNTVSKALRIAQLLLVISICLSGYLAFQALTGSQVAGCGPEESCGKVLSSKWSSILTVPISIPGLLTYLALLLITVVRNLREKLGGFLGATLALTIIFGALWFTGLQIFIIKSFCKYCCFTHAFATVASVLILLQIFKKEKVVKAKKGGKVNAGSKKQKAKGGKKAAPVVEVTPAKVGLLLPVILGLVAVAGTITLQSVGPEKDRSEVTLSEDILIAPHRMAPNAPLELSYAGGAYLLEKDVLQSVTLGKGTDGKDPVLLTYIFDWTCDHCRAFHEILHNLSKEDSPLGLQNQFIITYLPGAYETSSDIMHRVMYATYREDKEFYAELEGKLYSGEVKAMFNPAKNAVMEKFGKNEWANVYMKSNVKVKRALVLAGNQAYHNEQLTNVTLFPQLTSVKAIMSGVPTEHSLKAFLESAAQDQADYLAAPPKEAKKPVIMPSGTQGELPDPTKNPNSTKYGLKRNNSKIEFISSRAIRADGIKEGEIAEAKFKFKNTGTDPLKIYNMKGGCICTYGDSKEWRKEIMPGETGEITAYYNSHGKSNYGLQNRYIWVTSSASNYDEDDAAAVRYGNRILLQVPMLDKKGNYLLMDSQGKLFTKKTLTPLNPDAWDPNFMKRKPATK